MSSPASRIFKILIYILAALSIAAGIPKILQMPQELGFLGALGMPAPAVSALGVFQVSSGLLLLFARTRLAGTAMAELAFLVSSVAIFMTGDTMFGIASLIPVVAANAMLFHLLLAQRKPLNQEGRQ